MAVLILGIASSVRADDTSLKFFRNSDKADGNINRTQTSPTGLGLSDATNGISTYGASAISLTEFDSIASATYLGGGAGYSGNSGGGNLQTTAHANQTFYVSLVNDPGTTNPYTLSMNYQLIGSASVPDSTGSAYAYINIVNQIGSNAGTVERGYDYGSFPPLFTSPETLTFTGGFNALPDTVAAVNGSLTVFTVASSIPTDSPATLRASLTLASIHVLDSNGHQVAFSLTSAGTTSESELVASGEGYSGFHLTNTAAQSLHGTTVSLLGGTASADRAVNGTFSNSLSTLGAGQTAVSDALGLSGTTNDGDHIGDMIVLQFTLDESSLVAAGLNDLDASVMWLDPADGNYKDARFGNSDGGAAGQRILGGYNDATDFVLGNEGVDTVNHTVWAVVDHNSEFAAIAVAPVPEPATWCELAMGALVLAAFGRMRRSQV